MKKVIAITSLIALYSSGLATAQNTMPPLPSRILKEDFVKYMAAIMFHKDAKPRAGIAPLLMNKGSE